MLLLHQNATFDKITFFINLFDRVLEHLNQAGLYQNVRAILFGDLIDKGEPDGKFLVPDVIKEFAGRLSVPVLQIKNVGHGEINYPLVLGEPVKMMRTGKPCFLAF